MMFRAIACCAALVLGLLFSLSAFAAPACEGPDCKPGAPLDIKQFMREQAASTRAGQPQSGKARPAAATAQVKRHRKVAAQPKPAPLPVAEAPAAPQPEQQVQTVKNDEFNAIDRAAGAAPTPPETMGMSASDETKVRFVDSDEFNDIDRKADERALLAMAARKNDAATQAQPQTNASQSQTNVSWFSWLWSGVANTFAALATAVHNLIG